MAMKARHWKRVKGWAKTKGNRGKAIEAKHGMWQYRQGNRGKEIEARHGIWQQRQCMGKGTKDGTKSRVKEARHGMW